MLERTAFKRAAGKIDLKQMGKRVSTCLRYGKAFTHQFTDEIHPRLLQLHA